ncbi:MAG: bifunctional diaminohydroxyphosphoribosylaminopyrimidine deaminase/5-amino-6-(5-phosphoribosylamino)uracil reductase RibD, partial [Saprospiraceae bacterium]
VVAGGKIIGEGWHRQYGGPHAEVNAVNSVPEAGRHLLHQATLYVSLEPCCIFSKTPPCTDLIIGKGIPRVVISCLDATPAVSGNGVKKLRDAGVEVTTGVLKEMGEDIAAIRNVFAAKKRPFIILKFAKSKDGFMGQPCRQVWISGSLSARLVHKMRGEFDAFLVGTATAVTDNPRLTNRLWHGRSPLRIVIDKELRLPPGHHLLDDSEFTWVITGQPTDGLGERFSKTRFIRLPFDQALLPSLLALLYEHNKSSLVVEGGAVTLQHFLSAGLWDEAWVFTGESILGQGIAAPVIPGSMVQVQKIGADELTIYRNEALGS